MRRYPEYKESGVKWIGEIPTHWTITKLKYVSNIPVTYGLNIEADKYTTEGIRFIRITDIDENGGLRQKGVYLAENSVPQEQMLNGYDLLLSRSGATVGKSYLHLNEGKCTSAGYLVRFNFGDYCTSKFIYYTTLSHFYRDWLEQQIIISTIQNVNGEKYSNFQLPIPLHQEQTQIANFLDQKTGQIDELIRTKDRRIELLQEQRTALINQAVTKGLDPNVEMTPSGVEWIGEIPKDWDTVRCAHLFEVKHIKNTSGEINLSVYRDYGVIKRDSRDDNHNRVSEDTSNYKLVDPGDFVFNKMKCWQGSLGISEYRGIVSPAYTVCKPKKPFHGKYVHYLLRSWYYIQEFNRLSYGVRTGQWELRFEDFKDIVVPYPSTLEQIQIADFLDHKTKQIDELIKTEGQKIELLKEYRQSLISEAVTGKIDVRNEV